MNKILSGLLAVVSLFGLCTFGFVSKAEENPVQNVQETKKVKDTELVFIIDQSGSMSRLRDDTIGSFNSVIEQQKKDKEHGKVYVTTIMFSNSYNKIHDRQDIENIKEMTSEDYKPCGCTALLDAVGDTLNNLGKVDGIKSRNVVVAIITDGYENASKEYKKSDVKSLIETSEKNGWKVMYFGAGVDAFSDNGGAGLGIPKNRLWTVGHSQEGINSTFGCICDVVTATRAGN